LVLDPNLFPALLVGSVAGAGLTLTGADFLVSCVERHIDDELLNNTNMLSMRTILRPLMIATLSTVILFLHSGLVFIAYPFSSQNVLFLSIVFFFASMMVFLSSCLIFGIPHL
jgi:hypothetical protein